MTIRNRLAGIATAVAVASGAWFGLLAYAQTAPRPATKPSPVRSAVKPANSSEAVVAVVGGRKIMRATFEQRVHEAEEGYRQRSNSPIPAAFRPTMRRQVLEGMIREQLLVLEARRRGLTLSAEQAEEELKKDSFFQRNGVFDEAKYLAVKSTQPAQFRNALETIQSQLPAIRLKQQLERESSPGQSELKTEVERELSDVTIDFLALRRASVSIEIPEPSEREVIELYKAHASEYPRPEQVFLTLLTVNEPALPALHSDPASVQIWEARMKERADSLLAALKKGGRLEDLAPKFGTLRSGVEVTRDRFPDDWRGTARSQQSVFAASAGSLLGESVPGNNGFLLARIDQHRPPHTAALKEIVGTLRNRARAEIAARIDKQELGAIYAGVKDSLRGPAYRVRYAVADIDAVPTQEPSASEVDRYYRGHLADYSFFDAKNSSVGSKPLSEVRDDVRRRLLQERRTATARTTAEQLLASWKAGKRDAKLERAMTSVREVGPIPVGGAVDTGLAGSMLSDTLAERPGLRVDWIRNSRGWVVYQIFGEVKGYTPSMEEARPLLEARRAPLRDRRDEIAARKLYDENPHRFRAADLLRFSRLMVNLPDILTVHLTRDEVERYYRAHADNYGAVELARVRHILITPKDTSPRADAQARERAEEVMRRLKAGESFAALVKEFSDDEGTRDKGGDVGVFRRGMMLEDFEREAFTMKVGDLRGPVKSEVGYHVMECLEHVPAEVTPLRYAYSTVAGDAAHEKADRIARARADSLRRVLKNGPQARRAAQAMGLIVYRNEHVVGAGPGAEALKDYFRRIESLKPGQFDAQSQEYHGMGYAVTWMDEIVPQSKPAWEEVRAQAIDLYRREANHAVLARKVAEFDSMLHAGWTFDSLSTLFGGFERHGPHGPGSGLERLAGRELLDSLAFGTRKTPPVLQKGKPTGWIEFPAGFAMMRLVERHGPDPVQLAARLENENRGRLERSLQDVFEKLKDRYPVDIRDQDLKLTELPALPGS